MDIGWLVLNKNIILIGDVFSRSFYQRQEQAHSPRNSSVMVDKKNSEQVNFPENSIILQNVSINCLSVC